MTRACHRWQRFAPAIVIALAAPRLAVADRIKVTVVEVAGDIAYVTPGRAAGLTPGAKVTFGGNERAILEVTDDTASIKLDGLSLAAGQTGSADATAGKAQIAQDKALRAQPVQTGQWPDAVKPATTQQVPVVPLGAGAASGRIHVTMIGSGYGAGSKDNQAAQGEARVIASWDVLADRPLAFDADIAGRAFTAGYDKTLRVPVFVRALELRYGPAVDPTFAVGRLRYAAASVGMLDGARGSYKLGDLSIGAFGGIVPDPVNGKPDTSASRFGAEASYELSTNAWRPRFDATISGSTWHGTLDERRLTLGAIASKDQIYASAWGEAQAFSANNPWNAPSVQITGAGASGEWRDHGNHVGVDLDFMRPERSLRLADALPPEWLCTQEPQPGNTTETCRGSDYCTTATASAGTRSGRWSVDAYGTIGRNHTLTTALETSAYVRGEVALGDERLSLGGTVGKTTFGSWDSGELGIATKHWRPLDLALSAVGTTGPDRDVLAVLTTIIWRPLP